jgi:hypothetical protein
MSWDSLAKARISNRLGRLWPKSSGFRFPRVTTGGGPTFEKIAVATVSEPFIEDDLLSKFGFRFPEDITFSGPWRRWLFAVGST